MYIDCGLSKKCANIISSQLLTSLIHLKHLDISGNVMSKYISEFISNLSNLKYLENIILSDMKLTTSQIYELFVSLSSIDTVQSINLNSINILFI